MIYLDSAASYPMLDEVKQSVLEAFDNCYANSASSHLLGEEALQRVEQVREQLADKIGAFPSEIVFTSGATESNNIAFKSLLLGDPELANKKHIVISAIEHKCIFAICDYFIRLGFEISVVQPNDKGIIEPNAVEQAIRENTALVSVMHVNNELGTVNPIAEIGEICFSKGVLFHCDAAQSLCKTFIDVDDMNVDVMSFSGHKVGAPKGVGAIYIRDLRKRKVEPVIHGAGQEQCVRGGTVAAPLIIGFGAALEAFDEVFKTFDHFTARGYLIERLADLNIDYAVNGDDVVLPHIISLSLPKTNVSVLIRENEHQLCLAQGSACSSKEIEASHVLSALGLSREQAEHTFRISFTHEITHQNIDTLVEAIKKAAV